jgi:uncharacterized repeat protein (TIGR03843 family)
MPQDELRLLEHGTVEVLGRMPWGSNATLLAQICSDGDGDAAIRAVYKPRRGERPLWDFPEGLDRREVASYLLSEALGWGIVPPTVLREDAPFGVGSLQLFVPFEPEEHYFSLYEDPAHHDVLRTICCFDLLTNQTDRKSGHCLLALDDSRIWAIDNSLSFHAEPKLRTVIWEFGGEAIPAPLRTDVARFLDKGLSPELCALLTPEEQEALLFRAERIADDRSRFPLDGTGRSYPWPLV